MYNYFLGQNKVKGTYNYYWAQHKATGKETIVRESAYTDKSTFDSYTFFGDEEMNYMVDFVDCKLHKRVVY